MLIEEWNQAQEDVNKCKESNGSQGRRSGGLIEEFKDANLDDVLL